MNRNVDGFLKFFLSWSNTKVDEMNQSDKNTKNSHSIFRIIINRNDSQIIDGEFIGIDSCYWNSQVVH